MHSREPTAILVEVGEVASQELNVRANGARPLVARGKQERKMHAKAASKKQS
jgi:hypothetical protein